MMRRVIVRCSACDKPLYDRLPGWKLNLFAFVVFYIFMVWLTRPMHVPGVFLFALSFFMAIPWVIAEDRVYHTIWSWWHPTHCQGGHAQPETTS